MIPKKSSKELNMLLEEAQNKILKTQEDIAGIISDTIDKQLVLKNELEYNNYITNSLIEKMNNSYENNFMNGLENKITFFEQDVIDGYCESYGNITHSKTLKQPINVFNLATSNGYLFRDDVYLSLNGLKPERAKHMLMHDTNPAKAISFTEYDSPDLVLNVLTDIGNVLGNTDFNIIEIDSYLPGSFDIEHLEIFTDNNDIIENSKANFEMFNINNVGKTRIVFESKWPVLEVTFKIKLKFKNSNGKYPFGLKHLYFLNADFEPSSHLIKKVDKKKYIESISNDIYIKDYTSKESTINDEKAEIYLEYNNNVLEYKINPSTKFNEEVLPKNSKYFYIKIPLKNKVVSTLEFKEVKTR